MNISKHWHFATGGNQVKRKLNIGVLTIDFDRLRAVWEFTIRHFNQDLQPIKSILPNVKGQFKIDNSKNVENATGLYIPEVDGQQPAGVGIGEFDYFMNKIKEVGNDPLEFIINKANLIDDVGGFNNYDGLMGL